MQIDVTQAMFVIATPAVAMMVGSAAGLWRSPGPRLRSSFQHLAAGIIFAAVATELVPTLVAGPSWIAMIIGFAFGVVLMLGIRTMAGREDDESAETAARNPIGMMAGMGIDLFVDGLLVALALGAGEQGGLVLAAGISFETLFLGLALAATLGSRRKMLIVTAVVTALLLVAGGVLGIALLGWLSDPWRLGMLAFGTAALLYLVTEELLVEAHSGGSDSNIASALFFVGFGVTLAIAAAS
jgi:ZIP family zinc transporter